MKQHPAADRTCTVDGCDRPMKYSGTGWCARHYQRNQAHGSLDLPVRSFDRAAAMWSKLDVADCWLFTGHRNDWGYGTFWDGERVVAAHRWVYEHLAGPIDPALQLDHLCRQPACCNPDHLEAVTAAENNRRSGSATARNARKTHCKRGHELVGDNLRLTKTGRMCLTCDRMHSARRRQRRALEAGA